MKKRREGERRKRSPQWVIEVDVRAVLMLAVTVLVCLLWLLCCFVYLRTFLGISRFEVVGVSRYDDRDIITASGLSFGEKLYTLELDEVEERILRECPYLASVKVSTKFPGTLRVSVVGKKPEWYIDLAGDYYILDSDLIMVHESGNEDPLLIEGVTKLTLPGLQSVMHGEVPAFGFDESGKQNEDTVRKTVELLSMVRSTTFKGRITELDLSNRFAIYLTVDGSYHVYLGAYLGDQSSFWAKLKEVETVLNSDKAKQYPAAEIDASGEQVYFKPIS